MSLFEESIKLEEEEYRLIRDYIYDYCGIFFDMSSKFLLEKRLSRRLRIHGHKNFSEYYRFLKYDPKCAEEISTVLDIVTTNETYFFREQPQLKAFGEEILPEIMARKDKTEKRLSIWSAGCSTGEEPYTIAMIILDNGGFSGWDVEIFGNDISQRVLQVGRKGVYGKTSFRSTDDYYIRKYFEPVDDKYRIKDSVRSLVRFGCLNLIDRNKMALLRKMDVIFCRNVLIYFDLEAKKRVIQNFYEKLLNGGYLLQGHAESLINISTDFEICHLKNDLVYRKPLKKEVFNELELR